MGYQYPQQEKTYILTVKMDLKKSLTKKSCPLTYEIVSPRGWYVASYLENLAWLKGRIDAVSFPDNPRASVRLSPIAYAKYELDKLGIEPIVHAICRDRNYLSLISDLLGAHLLGVKNVLLLSGDGYEEFHRVKEKWFIDPIELGHRLRMMNEGVLPEGYIFEGGKRTAFFTGGAIIFGRKNELIRLEEKIEAGFEFFISQVTYSAQEVIDFFSTIEKVGLEFNKPVQISLAPVASLRMLDELAKIQNLRIPADFEKEMELSREQTKTSVERCIEIAHDVKKNLRKYRIGFHIIPFGFDDLGKNLLEGMDKEIKG